MINFACTDFDLDEVVKCVLGLSKSEFRLLKYLAEHDKKYTTEELSKNLNLDKSTIQRSIKTLHGKGLVSRSQINRSIGGYVFLYKLGNKEEIRKTVRDTIDSWATTFRKKISVW